MGCVSSEDIIFQYNEKRVTIHYSFDYWRVEFKSGNINLTGKTQIECGIDEWGKFAIYSDTEKIAVIPDFQYSEKSYEILLRVFFFFTDNFPEVKVGEYFMRMMVCIRLKNIILNKWKLMENHHLHRLVAYSVLSYSNLLFDIEDGIITVIKKDESKIFKIEYSSVDDAVSRFAEILENF